MPSGYAVAIGVGKQQAESVCCMIMYDDTIAANAVISLCRENM